MKRLGMPVALIPRRIKLMTRRMPMMADRPRGFHFPLLIGACVLFLFGCSSAKVVENSATYSDELKTSQFIYIERFAVGGEWKVDREGKELDEFKQTISEHLQEMMLSRFQEIAPTDLAPKKLPK
jgi:hypothetical protein